MQLLWFLQLVELWAFALGDLASFLFKMIEACIQRSKVDESTNDIISGPVTNEDIMNSLLKLKERQEKFETETKAMFKESKCCKDNLQTQQNSVQANIKPFS